MRKSILFFLLIYNFSFAQTDYSDLTNWYYHPDKLLNLVENYDLDIAVISKDLSIDSLIEVDNQSTTNTGVDVFWVHPTQLIDPPSNPTVVELSDQPFALISATILVQGALLAKYGRFFAPRYRQASPASFLNPVYSDSTRAAALISTYSDIKAAFLHYLDSHNNGNRIILAGHSQGSFLLAMLLRDLFDNNPDLRSRLVTAALGGMPYVHASSGSYLGGQWENIPLCTQKNECGCIHNWRSFKEAQTIPALVTTLPVFNQVLADSGLVYRTVNLAEDWFVHDSLIYSAESAYLRYYIAPDANYNLGGGPNFIAFDSLYLARNKRTSATKTVLAIDYIEDATDQRPNDLLPLEGGLEFLLSGFHTKDYHIYLWALLNQIDAKLDACATTSVATSNIKSTTVNVYPNPSHGTFYIETDAALSNDDELTIVDVYGRVVKKMLLAQSQEVQLDQKGIYFLLSKYGRQTIVIY